MKVGFRKTRTGFEYTGDLGECIDYAKKKLLQHEQNLPYITKRFLEEQKRYDTLKRSIENCKRFIIVAKKEIQERLFDIEENENKGKGTENERNYWTNWKR